MPKKKKIKGLLLDPKYDVVFKRLMTDPQNREFIKDFLKTIAEVQDDELENLEFLDTHLLPKCPDMRTQILDVRIITKSDFLAVEMQREHEIGERERFLLYLVKPYTEQLKKDQAYHQLKKSLLIVITDFTLLKEEEDCINYYFLQNRRSGNIFVDKLELITFELTKQPKNVNERVYYWWRFLNMDITNIAEIEETKKLDSTIEEAIAKLEELSSNEELRRIVEVREKNRLDEFNRIYNAEARGKAEGRAEVAINLLKKGLNLSLIAETTDFSLEELEELKANI
jgi:predicted transposase/invertase (TIGR01784 family)